MIVTVTPNPAVDMTYHVDSFDQGETLRVSTGSLRAGGKGVNVARVIRQTRGDALAVTTAGGDTGRELAGDLAASGLDHRLVGVEAPTRRSIAIVDAQHRTTTIMNEHGSALTSEERAALMAAVDASLDGASCLVGSGSLPPGMPDTFYADLVRLGHERQLPVVIDAVGTALLRAAEAGADVVKPNRAELGATTGTDDPIEGALRLIEAGAGMVFVSLGEEGMLAVDANRDAPPLRAFLPRALDGNPTGAGDAAVAAVSVALAGHGQPLEAMLRRATAWSAAAVLMPVAGSIADNYRELEQLLTVEPWADADPPAVQH
jgi:1-phosphofructokinase family hexose kinase